MVGLLFLAAPVAYISLAHADIEPVFEWEAPLPSCVPADVVIDEAGRSYVACHDTSGHAPRIIAYAPDGAELARIDVPKENARDLLPVDMVWASGSLYLSATARLASGSDAVLVAIAAPTLRERWRASRTGATAFSVAAAPDGGPWLALTRTTASADIVLLRFNAAGAVRAEGRYDSGQDDGLDSQRRSLAVTSSGHVYVAAHQQLLRFSPEGQLLWHASHPAYAVAVDEDDNALVTSPLQPEGQTARFASDGARMMHIDKGGFAVAPAADGGVWISGTRVTDNARQWDLVTTLLDARGRVVFADRYDGGNQDRFVDMAVDGTGDAYVLASSYVPSGLFGTADRYLLLRYTALDQRLWSEIYGRTGLPSALAVTDGGRLVATGYDGTVSFTQDEARACAWWWPGCWFH